MRNAFKTRQEVRSLLCLLMLMVVRPALASTEYTVVDLGAVTADPTKNSQANAVNLSGTVIGYQYVYEASSGYYRQHACYWTGITGTPVVTDLGTLGGYASNGTAINNAGVMTGFALNSSSTGLPYISTGGSMTALVSPPNFGYGQAVSNSGLLLGQYDVFVGGANHNHPFIYNVLTATITDTYSMGMPMDAMPGAINDVGQIAYQSVSQAYLFSGGSSYNLGNLGIAQTYPAAMNNQGEIVGASRLNDANWTWTACRWRPDSYNLTSGTLKSLGNLVSGGASIAYAINSWGEIVGYAETAPGSSRHAFIYRHDKIGMQDLNGLIASGSGWILQTANGINDKGVIVGSGTYGGYTHAYALLPIP